VFLIRIDTRSIAPRREQFGVVTTAEPGLGEADHATRLAALPRPCDLDRILHSVSVILHSVSVNSVLPMAGAFGVLQDQAAWILATYISPLLFSLPISIWMAGRVGYLRNIIGSAIIFAVASVSL
jgi:hypothetical protein